MEAIAEIKTSLEHKMDSISIEMNLIRADLTKTNEKIKHLDIQTSSLTDVVTQLQREVTDLKTSHMITERKLDDYDGRLRRNNLRILGVPENAEGLTPDLFKQKLILNHLKPKGLGKLFVIEWAH